jgi:hypothetical protein
MSQSNQNASAGSSNDGDWQFNELLPFLAGPNAGRDRLQKVSNAIRSSWAFANVLVGYYLILIGSSSRWSQLHDNDTHALTGMAQ